MPTTFTDHGPVLDEANKAYAQELVNDGDDSDEYLERTLIDELHEEFHEWDHDLKPLYAKVSELVAIAKEMRGLKPTPE